MTVICTSLGTLVRRCTTAAVSSLEPPARIAHPASCLWTYAVTLPPSAPEVRPRHRLWWKVRGVTVYNCRSFTLGPPARIAHPATCPWTCYLLRPRSAPEAQLRQAGVAALVIGFDGRCGWWPSTLRLRRFHGILLKRFSVPVGTSLPPARSWTLNSAAVRLSQEGDLCGRFSSGRNTTPIQSSITPVLHPGLSVFAPGEFVRGLLSDLGFVKRVVSLSCPGDTTVCSRHHQPENFHDCKC